MADSKALRRGDRVRFSTEATVDEIYADGGMDLAFSGGEVATMIVANEVAEAEIEVLETTFALGDRVAWRSGEFEVAAEPRRRSPHHVPEIALWSDADGFVRAAVADLTRLPPKEQADG